MTPISLGAYGDLWRLLAGANPRKLALVLTLMALVGLTEGASLFVLVTLLDAVGVTTTGSAVDGLTRRVLDVIVSLGLPATLTTSLLLFVGLVTGRALLSRFETTASVGLVSDTLALLRKRLYRALVNASWLYLSRGRTSAFTFVLTEEVDRVGSAVYALLALLITVLMTGVYLSLALLLSVPLTLLVLGSGLLLVALLRGRVRQARRRGEEVSEAYGAMYDAADEHFAGIRTSKSHGFEGAHVAAFLSIAERVGRADLDVEANRASVRFWFEVGAVVILAVTLWTSLTRFGLAVDGVLLLLFLFSRMIPLITRLQGQVQALLADLPAYEAVEALVAASEAAAEPLGTGRGPAPALERSLALEGVTFRYGPDLPAVVDDLTLTLEAHRTTALVGPSGAGKSTVADLVTSLLQPERGRVTVDGTPFDGDLGAWRGAIGYVAQTSFLFDTSVRANLLLARPDADERDLWEALEAAAARAFVEALPHGLDTVVGERGVRLSGGERQRLSLARALLREPVLLVLDEATSSLDSENEAHIQSALRRLHGKVTLLVIAHRLATVSNADMIYVLDEGRLIESGPWADLLDRRDGRFRAWCEAQGLIAPTGPARA